MTRRGIPRSTASVVAVAAKGSVAAYEAGQLRAVQRRTVGPRRYAAAMAESGAR